VSDPWVRRAVVHDAEVIGDLHVRSWQAAYRGLMPQAYLDALDVGERRAFWREGIKQPPPGCEVLVACHEAAVVGFTAWGPEEAPEPTGRGQVFALNVDPEAWGTGAGAALLEAACDRLRADGYGSAVLWVLAGHEHGRAFYERHGWTPDGHRGVHEVLGVSVPQVRYRLLLA